MPRGSAADADGTWAAVLVRWVPALASLRGYGTTDARADFMAGLTVAATAVPQAMAYALIAGLPPEIGLYTAIVMTLVGALLNSSRLLINGPTNAIAIALLSAIGTVASPEDRIEVAILLAFLMGAIQVSISLLRLGDLTRYVSHSVIVGFTAGASVLLLLDQTKNLLGLVAVGGPHDHFLHRFWLTLTQGGSPHGPTLGVGLASMASLLGLRWAKSKLHWPLFPEILVTVVLAAAAIAWFGLDAQGVKVIGAIPESFPSLSAPNFDAARMRDLASGALALALLGLLEAIAMAKALAVTTREKLDLNQQCLSEGVANLTGSFFHCMPGSGSLTRSAINQQAGARTQWAGVVSAVAVALTMLVFAPYARHVPRSALAALLMLTALRMVNVQELRYHVRVSRFDAVIVAVTAISAVAISVEFCVLIGVFLSFLLAVPRTGQMLRTEFVVTPEGGIHERLAEDVVCGHVLIFGLEGEMFFGSVASLETHLEAIEDRVQPDTHVVVMRMKRARNPDAAGMAIFERFVQGLQARGVRVLLCGVRPALDRAFRRSGLAARFNPDDVFLEQPVRQTSTLLAVQHATDLVPAPCQHCPPRRKDGPGKGLYYAP